MFSLYYFVLVNNSGYGWEKVEHQSVEIISLNIGKYFFSSRVALHRVSTFQLLLSPSQHSVTATSVDL